MVNLSKLEEIKDLRTVWPHEALDFTPWLSQDDNIALLADAVGLDITVDETESSVGDFNVDIFSLEQQSLFNTLKSLIICDKKNFFRDYIGNNLSK